MESLRQPAKTWGGGIGRLFGRRSGARTADPDAAAGRPRGRRFDSIEARLCVVLAAVSGLFVLGIWRGLEPSSADLVAVALPSATAADVGGIAAELKAAGTPHEVRFGVLYVRAEDAPRVAEQFRSGRPGSASSGGRPASASEAPGSY